MTKKYQFSQIEQEVQLFWKSHKTFFIDPSQTNNTQDKLYCLEMFPYTSGKLHMGHVRTYVIGDLISRYYRMKGKKVLHPMGWDAFGLPAENAAKIHGISPEAWTESNVAQMKEQMDRLGLGFDWDKELVTCHPNYYKHEQWFFIELWRKGLAYQAEALVYWDPVDQTILANEQVIDGKGWRSNAPVVKKLVKQWFIRTDQHVQELEQSLHNDLAWPEAIIKAQKTWIGKSEGFTIVYPIETSSLTDTPSLTVFTTQPKTVTDVTCLILAPRHSLSLQLSVDNPDIKKFIDEEAVITAKHFNKDIKGVYTGLSALHPLTGAKLPIWISNFVQDDYGTGAVQCAPSRHDKDAAFAKAYNIKYQPDSFCPLTAKELNNIASAHTCYKLKDWSVSRQRYWGTPIPMLYCKDCGTVPADYKDLPIKVGCGDTLPCSQCGKAAQRELDTFDTFFESSWYYARFISPNSSNFIADYAKNWLPVDYYIGGLEHATLHFLYARLFYRFMRDMGLVPVGEPFTKVISQGMVLKDGNKMSKSKGNIVDPAEIIEHYGADCLRLFIIMAAPVAKNFSWEEGGLIGCSRFLNKLYDLVHQTGNAACVAHLNMPLPISYQQEVNNILNSFTAQGFNNIVTGCMKLLNMIDVTLSVTTQIGCLSALLRLVYPIAPHLTTYLWSKLDYGQDISTSPLPLLRTASFLKPLVVQLNGKKIGLINTKADSSQTDIQALAEKQYSQKLTRVSYSHIIYKPNIMINFVTANDQKATCSDS